MLDDKGFDLWADGYDKAVGLSEESDSYPFAGYKSVLDGIYKEILSRRNAVVLDLGFGTGTLTTRLYENGCKVYGQDFSKRMIEIASAKMPDAELYQGDFANGLVPELSAQKYDYIVGTYSLHHLTDDQKTFFFRELLPLLNDGGKLLIGDIAFRTRTELENCKNEVADDWDDEEIYFVVDELKRSFPKLVFLPKSFCSGIIEIRK